MTKQGYKIKNATCAENNDRKVKNDKTDSSSVNCRILESRGIKVTFINKKEVITSNVGFIAIYKPRRSPIML